MRILRDSGRRGSGLRTAGLLALIFVAAPASAQPRHPADVKAPSVSSLTAQGYEVRAVEGDGSLILQKGTAVFRCLLRLGKTRPMSYQSECYAIY
jgi:hypothetical protein